MPPNDNRRPGVASRNGGEYDSSNSAANVIRLYPERKISSAWDDLTVELIVARQSAGNLDPALLRALAEYSMGMWA
jgi:hypothetical protein